MIGGVHAPQCHTPEPPVGWQVGCPRLASRTFATGGVAALSARRIVGMAGEGGACLELVVGGVSV